MPISAKENFENFQQNQQLEIFTFAENFQNDQCEYSNNVIGNDLDNVIDINNVNYDVFAVTFL